MGEIQIYSESIPSECWYLLEWKCIVPKKAVILTALKGGSNRQKQKSWHPLAHWIWSMTSPSTYRFCCYTTELYPMGINFHFMHLFSLLRFTSEFAAAHNNRYPIELRPMALNSLSTRSIITTDVCSKFENNPSSASFVMAFTPFIAKSFQTETCKTSAKFQISEFRHNGTYEQPPMSASKPNLIDLNLKIWPGMKMFEMTQIITFSDAVTSILEPWHWKVCQLGAPPLPMCVPNLKAINPVSFDLSRS